MSTKARENAGRVVYIHVQSISRNNLDLVGIPKNYILENLKVSLYQNI